MYQIIGFQRMDFETKEGQQIKGTKLFLTYESEKVEGIGCESIYVSNRVSDLDNIQVGSHCEISYNRYGKVSHVEII